MAEQIINPIARAEFEAAYDAGLAAAAVQNVEGLHHITVPKGATITMLPDLRQNPTRKTGTIVSRGVRDFTELVKREQQDNTIILCEFVNGASVTGSARAIIDYHAAGEKGDPNWAEYSIILNLTPTAEWTAWNGMFNRELNHVDFAEFLEEHLADISNPLGADVLEVALTLQAKKYVQFESGTRLQNRDTKLVFVENTKTTAGARGDMEIPSEIELFIPPFEGFPSQKIKCMLRFRILNSTLSFTLKPMNLPQCLRQTRDQVVEDIREATSLLVADGTFTAVQRKV